MLSADSERTTGTRYSAAQFLLRAIGEQRGKSGFAPEGFDDGFNRLREKSVLGAVGDYLVGIVCQDGKNFGAIRCREMRATGANRDFALARGASVAQCIDKFRAESFHRVPASNFFG